MEDYVCDRELCRLARQFWHEYILNNQLSEICLSPQCVWIGTGEADYCQSEEEIRKSLRQKSEMRALPDGISEECYQSKRLSEKAVLIYGGMRISRSGRIVDSFLRFSMIFEKNGGKWELSHIHQSAPGPDPDEEDACMRAISSRVREMLSRDRMTGLYHHEAFWRNGRQRLAEKSQCYCYLMDINQFKLINDMAIWREMWF